MNRRSNDVDTHLESGSSRRRDQPRWCGVDRQCCCATKGGAARLFVERSGVDCTATRFLRDCWRTAGAYPCRSSPSLLSEWHWSAANVPNFRSHQSEPEALGQGANEKE